MILKVENGNMEIVSYPRMDKSPVVGLSPNIEFYVIRDNKPNYDSNTQYLEESGFTLTKGKDIDYKHLNIADKNYQIKDLIIEKTIDEKIKELQDVIILLSKEEKNRTQSDKDKINELKSKIEK